MSKKNHLSVKQKILISLNTGTICTALSSFLSILLSFRNDLLANYSSAHMRPSYPGDAVLTCSGYLGAAERDGNSFDKRVTGTSTFVTRSVGSSPHLITACTPREYDLTIQYDRNGSGISSSILADNSFPRSRGASGTRTCWSPVLPSRSLDCLVTRIYAAF